MNKLIKRLSLFILIIVFIFILTACGGFVPNQKYADKINKSILQDSPYRYSKVLDQLGKPIRKGTSKDNNNQIYCVWLEGYNTLEDAQIAFDNDEIVYGLIITFENNKATSAIYAKWTEFDQE